jgi:hypothetical protein
MNLPLLAIPVFLLSPTSAANCFRRHCRTLSATAKKPAPTRVGAGFRFLFLNLNLRFALSLSLAPPSPCLISPAFITQTPNSF